MREAAMMLGAMLSPLLALGLLLWLAHLEETLPRDVQAAQRKPAPPPILTVPVPTQPVRVPAQRLAPDARPGRAEAATGAEGALST